jgi:peptidyl-prolyl cis-trans isomerase SurA
VYRFLLLFLLLAAPASAQVQVLDEIVALIGDRIVLRSDVDALAATLALQQQQPVTDALWRQALGDLVNRQVLVRAAEADTTIEVDQAQVTRALNDRIERLAQQAGGEDALEQAYNRPLYELREDLRTDLRDELLVQQLQGRKFQSIRISPAEVRAWFQTIPQDSLPIIPASVRIAQIARTLEPSDAAKQEALGILATIRDSVVTGGATLEEMASQFSDDAVSAREGGRIADIRLSELVPEFAAVVARTPAGEISQPFRTVFGYHIVRVNDLRGDVADFNHILIRVNEASGDPQPAIDFLTQVRDSVVTYERPFELMARRHSQDVLSANQGGRVTAPRTQQRDLPIEALGADWQATITDLEEGEISDPRPVTLLNGRPAYHIVLLQRRTPAHRISFEQDYEQLEQIALREKQARELQEWVERLADDVYVEYRGKGAEVIPAETAAR